MDAFVVKLEPPPPPPPDARPVAALIDDHALAMAARAHPLVPVLAGHVREAFSKLRSTTLNEHGPLIECIARMRGNRGSLIGTLFEFYMSQLLTRHGFRGQEHKHEPDFVCVRDPLLSFELKTTSTSLEDVYGNRVSASARHKKGTFLLAVAYDMQTLEVRRVRFGWVTPDDWIPQCGNGQQARLSPSARNAMVCVR